VAGGEPSAHWFPESQKEEFERQQPKSAGRAKRKEKVFLLRLVQEREEESSV